MRLSHLPLWFSIALLTSCAAKEPAEEDNWANDEWSNSSADTGTPITGTDDCNGAPTIEHDEFDDAQPIGVAVTIDAVVIGDPTPGCGHITPSAVYLYYKMPTSVEYQSPIQMSTEDNLNFSAIIPSEEISSYQMLYYFRAVGSTKETEEPAGSKEGNRNAFEFSISI